MNVLNRVRGNYLIRHIVFIDLTLVLVLLIGLGSYWIKFSIQAITAISIVSCDLISCLIQLQENKSTVSVESATIYQTAVERNKLLEHKYTAVLMRYQLTDNKLNVDSEASLFDTNLSYIGDDRNVFNNKDNDLEGQKLVDNLVSVSNELTMEQI